MNRIWVLVSTCCLLIATPLVVGCRAADSGVKEAEGLPRDSMAAVRYLAAELGIGRPIEPRLSASFRYQPCLGTGGALAEPACAPSVEEATAESLLRIPEQVEGWNDTAAELQGQALLYLVLDRGAMSATHAVRRLERARARGEADAELLSDLAAALIVRGQRRRAPWDFALALARAEEALRLDGECLEGRFNQALALHKLGLREAASTAWREYLARDTDSAWAAEATLHRVELQGGDAVAEWPQARRQVELAARRGDAVALRSLLKPFRLAVRLDVEERLLPRWASLYLEGSAREASEVFKILRVLAAELADAGDPLLRDAVAAIERCQKSEPDSSCLAELARGHRLYGEAVGHYSDFHIEDARQDFAAAQKIFSRQRSPFRFWAELHLAICDLHHHEYARALAATTELKREAEQNNYGSLAGRADWIAALCHLSAARPFEALVAYQLALASFQAIGEEESGVSIQARLADTLRNLGEGEKAWTHLHQALLGLPRLHQVHRKHLVLGEAALASLTLDEPLAAGFFQDAAVRLLQGADEDLELAYALGTRAAIHLAVDDPEQAVHDLEAAQSHAAEARDDHLRLEVEGLIHGVEGRIWRRTNPRRSIDSLNRALDAVRGTRFHLHLAMAYFERALSYRAMARYADAEADLVAALLAVEAEWYAVQEGSRPSTHLPAYFRHRQEIFRELISLLDELGRSEEALAYVERSRARDVLNQVLDHQRAVSRAELRLEEPANPLSPEKLRHDIPPRTTIIEYALLPDRLLGWVVRRTGIQRFAVEVGEEEIVFELDRVYAGLAGELPNRDLTAGLERLYEILVGSWLDGLDEGELVVFVPDGPLHWVPFAGLRETPSGRYLIERNPMAVAPSGTLFVRALRRDRELAAAQLADSSALIIGDPAVDRSAFPDLSPLPAANYLARDLASLYPRSRLLRGTMATRNRVLEELEFHEVIHVAGHAVLNPAAPFRSALVLAPDSGNRGSLYAHELLGQRLDRTRLIVLSGCSTAGGRLTGAQGVTGFVRPLISAGVPTVVASLWDVYDRATARLFGVFHRQILAGRHPAEALRAAQLELLRHPNQNFSGVSKWAAFEVIGASSLQLDTIRR